MFYCYVYFYYSLFTTDVVLELKIPFHKYLVPSPVRNVACLQCFPVTRHLITSGQLRFSRQLNPDWSIQISGASAVCKASGTSNLGLIQYLLEINHCLVKKKCDDLISTSEAFCINIKRIFINDFSWGVFLIKLIWTILVCVLLFVTQPTTRWLQYLV